MRPEQEPEVNTSWRGGEKLSHPAFGQIAASRVSGRAHLYGSDFYHHSTIRIRIGQSSLERDLARDWYHVEKELIEVEISAAQWAEFVSSFNVGQGVCCTIRTLGGKMVPDFPYRDSADRYHGEFREDIKQTKVALDELRSAILDGKMTEKERSRLLSHVDTALRELACNAPFVAESFEKHMETRVEKAKTEVNAYMENAIHRAGLQALAASEGAPLLLPEPVQESCGGETASDK